MSRYRRIEIIEPSPPPSLFIKQTSIFTPTLFAFEDHDHLDFALDLLRPTPTPALFDFHHFDTITDLLQIDRTTPHHTTSTRRLVHHRVAAESSLQTLCDRVSALELTFDKLVNAKPHHHHSGDRKYTWTAEVNDKHGLDRKYKWTAEIKGGENNKKEKKEEVKGGGAAEKKKYKWTAKIKDKREESPISRSYVFEVSTGDGADCSGSEKKEKKKDNKNGKKKECGNGAHTRLVEIEEPSNNNHGAFVLRQVCFVTVQIKLSNLFLRKLEVVINLMLLSVPAVQ